MDSYAAFVTAGVELDTEMADMEAWLSDFVAAAQAESFEPVGASHACALASPDTSVGPASSLKHENANSVSDVSVVATPVCWRSDLGMGAVFAGPCHGMADNGKHSGLTLLRAPGEDEIGHGSPTCPLPLPTEVTARTAHAVGSSQLDVALPAPSPAISRHASADGMRGTGAMNARDLGIAACDKPKSELGPSTVRFQSDCEIPAGCYVMTTEEFWSDVWLPFTLAAVAMVSSMRGACMKHRVARPTAAGSHWVFAFNWDQVKPGGVRHQLPPQQPEGSPFHSTDDINLPSCRRGAKPLLSEAYRDTRCVKGAIGKIPPLSCPMR